MKIRGEVVTFLFACVVFSLPLSATADISPPPPSLPSVSLTWGNADGTAPAQIQIVDGGVYEVPLGVSAPAFFSFDDGTDSTYVSSSLSRVVPPSEPDGQETREFVAFVAPLERSRTSFAWPSAGEYELTAIQLPVFQESRVPSLFALLIGEVAHADSLFPAPPRKIRFTIREVPRCTQDCFSNVLFLPGIESSRLYRPGDEGGEDKLWEPNTNADVRDLFLTPAGESIRNDIYTKEGDVLDELPIVGINVYKSFLGRMDALKSSGAIVDYEAVPYDWRLSLDDILQYGQAIDGKVYYVGENRATSTPYIVQELRRLAATSKSGKVTIIAHSNGGLVAKQLTQLFGDEVGGLIDSMIFVAVPQAGTPMAIPAALHGYEQDHGPFGIVTSEATARAFASTSPMAYHLLPSAQYFTYVDDPVVNIDDSLPEWQAQYGETVHSHERLQQFVTGVYGKTESDDIDVPIRLDAELMTRAQTLHDSLDVWTSPQGVELIQIAGWGVPKTVKGVTYKAHEGEVQTTADFTVDGDGTVVVPSALWTREGKNYWVDLAERNRLLNRVENLNLRKIKHMDVLEVEPLLDFIDDSLQQKQLPISNYPFISEYSPSSIEKRLHYSLHSPLTLDLYDEHGNHTGVATSTGRVEENIPGTYFVQFGDTKYLFVDSGVPHHIVMSGYDTGTFTFEVGEVLGDTTTHSIAFRDVPTTPQTKVRFDVSSDIFSASDLLIDEDGDGTFETTYASSTGERVVPVVVADEPVAPSGNGMPVANTTTPEVPIPVTIQTVLGAATTTEVATTTYATTTSAEKVIPKQKLVVKKQVFRSVQKEATTTIENATLVASVASAEIPHTDFLARIRGFLKKFFHSVF